MRSLCNIIVGFCFGSIIANGILQNKIEFWLYGVIGIVAFGGFMLFTHKKHIKDINSLR